MSTTKAVIKTKTTGTTGATTGTATGTTSATGTTGSTVTNPASAVATVGAVQKEVAQKPPSRSSGKTQQTQVSSSTPSGRTGRAPTRQEYVEPEEDLDEGEDYDEYGYDQDQEHEGYDMDQMEAMREYENQRMAEVFTQVLATVFTYENITLPETILTLSQALDTHNKTQEGILQALNKIADKLSK